FPYTTLFRSSRLSPSLKIGQITPLVQSVGNFSSRHTLQQRTHTARFTLSPPLFRTSATISSWPADFASFRRSKATITSTRVIFLSKFRGKKDCSLNSSCSLTTLCPKSFSNFPSSKSSMPSTRNDSLHTRYTPSPSTSFFASSNTVLETVSRLVHPDRSFSAFHMNLQSSLLRSSISRTRFFEPFN